MKQRPDGRWLKVVTVKGKKQYFYSNATTERQAVKDINKQIMEFDIQQKEEATTGKKFSEVAEMWKLQHFPTLENNSLKAYRPSLKCVTDYFGETGTREITALDVERFVQSLVTRNYALKTVKQRLLVLNLIFKFAYIKGYSDANPCQYVTVPKNLPKTKRENITKEDIELIKENWNISICGKLALFLLTTGCRRGEALALRYSDINYENKTVSITKTVEWLGNIAQIKDHPKTDAGIREIPLPDILFTKLFQNKTSNKNALIFPNYKGELISNSNLTRMWDTYCKSTGIKATPHQLRHAYATILYDAGIDVKTAQTFLGHANIQTTLNIYTHLSETRKSDAVQKINAFLVK